MGTETFLRDASPRHVAIIMDGNGRWAVERGRPRTFGHHRGAERVREIVSTAPDLGIEVLTLFAFSSENWSRPSDEVNGLMRLFIEVLQREQGNKSKAARALGIHRRKLYRLLERFDLHHAEHGS